MTKSDKRGNPVSYHSQAAIDALDRAADMLAAYKADTLGAIDAVIAEHPDFALAHAMRAGALATATDKAFEDEALKSQKAADALAPKANEREQLHIAGGRAWLDGDLVGGAELWGRASMLYPRDLTALQLAHAGDFFLGYSHMLRDRVARVLPKWNRNVPGYGFVHGMYAFGLEESGDYAAAETHGREACGVNRQDGWAAHAVAHV
ncbi:MAG: tetratricopeptide repeat protein, partial [Micropepsaceae bacterium]